MLKPAAPLVIVAALRDLEEFTRNEVDPAKKRFFLALKTILSVISRDWDESVVSRLEEIEALSDLLRRGTAIIPGPLCHLLKETVKQAVHDRDNLRISALDATLDRLRAALIELHESLESNSPAEAKALLGDVWSFLGESSKRRALDIPWF